MGDSSPQQPTQTTTTQISPQAQQLFNLAYPGLQSFAAQTPQRYQGETVAGFTPAQTQAQQDIMSGAGTAKDVSTAMIGTALGIPGSLDYNVAGMTPFQRTPYTGTPLTTSSDIFSDPGIWNPQYNTGLQEAISAAQRPMWQALTETALPAIRTTALSQGPAGSSREGIAEGLATGRTSQAAADIGRKMTEDEYAANLAALQQRYGTNIGAENQRYATDVAGAGQRYGTDVGAETARYGTDINATNQRYGVNTNAILSALGLTPMLQQSAFTPGAAEAAVGDVQQQQQQALINEAMQKFNFDQYAPYMQSRDLLSLVQSMPGATNVSTASVPQANPYLQSAGGALSGAALGSMFGPIGMGVGAVGGGLLPFLFR